MILTDMFNKDRYLIQDIESGEYEEVSEEHYRMYQACKFAAQFKWGDSRFGKIIVFGTGGGEESEGYAEGLTELFYPPSEWNIIPFEEAHFKPTSYFKPKDND